MFAAQSNRSNIYFEVEGTACYSGYEVPVLHTVSSDKQPFSTNKKSRKPEGEMENNYEGMTSLQKKSVISKFLSAAAAAAVRRLETNDVGLSEQLDAVHVLEIVEEQRAFMQDQVREEPVNSLLNPEVSSQLGSLDERLKVADAKFNRQQKDTTPFRQTGFDDFCRE